MAATKLSTTNEIPGKIASLEKGEAVSIVEIEFSHSTSPVKITSVITNDVVSNLDLKVGDPVITVIKPTEVMIEK